MVNVATVVLAEEGQMAREEARALKVREAGRARASIAKDLVEAIVDVMLNFAKMVATESIIDKYVETDCRDTYPI